MRSEDRLMQISLPSPFDASRISWAIILMLSSLGRFALASWCLLLHSWASSQSKGPADVVEVEVDATGPVVVGVEDEDDDESETGGMWLRFKTRPHSRVLATVYTGVGPESGHTEDKVIDLLPPMPRLDDDEVLPLLAWWAIAEGKTWDVPWAVAKATEEEECNEEEAVEEGVPWPTVSLGTFIGVAPLHCWPVAVRPMHAAPHVHSWLRVARRQDS